MYSTKSNRETAYPPAGPGSGGNSVLHRRAWVCPGDERDRGPGWVVVHVDGPLASGLTGAERVPDEGAAQAEDVAGFEDGMKIAYADPPYLGEARKRYGKIHEQAADYDDIETHRDLIAHLRAEFPDGWAMSLHVPSLRHILPECPDDCRVGAWVKTFVSFKPNVSPAFAWEPVIFRGGRKPWGDTVRDWTACRIAMQRGFPGAKPEAFCMWIFRLMGLTHDDEFVDLFPGSGAVLQAWEKYKRQVHLL